MVGAMRSAWIVNHERRSLTQCTKLKDTPTNRLRPGFEHRDGCRVTAEVREFQPTCLSPESATHVAINLRSCSSVAMPHCTD